MGELFFLDSIKIQLSYIQKGRTKSLTEKEPKLTCGGPTSCVTTSKSRNTSLSPGETRIAGRLIRNLMYRLIYNDDVVRPPPICVNLRRRGDTGKGRRDLSA